MSEPLIIETGNQVSIDQIKSVFYLAVGRLCQCGKKKSSGNPFCNNCMNKLTAHMRNRLYLMVRRTFVIAYMEAAETLPKAGPVACGCGCGETVPFPWKYKQGHMLRKGAKQGKLNPASTPAEVVAG